MKGTTTGKAVLVALLTVVSAACAATRREEVTYHDANMDFSLVQTVAVMPFGNLTPLPAAAERVRDAFMTMLQATGSMYVLPPGEVGRGINRANLQNPATPTADDVVALVKIVKADAVITGVVREYGEVRSGTAAAPVVSVSLKMLEGQTGKVVWSASASEGGITAGDRLFGGGGKPMDEVTEKTLADLLDKLFKK